MTATKRRVARARIRYNRGRRSIWWLASRAGGQAGRMLRAIFPQYPTDDSELEDIITEHYGRPRLPGIGIAPRGGLLFPG